MSRADLISLYHHIARQALPHVRGRPLTLVRMRKPITRPDGLRTQAEFVRHTATQQSFISSVVPRMHVREQKKVGEYCYVENELHLLALIDSGVIEWHVWNARIDDVEHPDRVIFDVDPGEGIAWNAVIAAARELRDRLRELNLASWVKTTGGNGLHVVVPFRPEHTWATAYEFSRIIATAMAHENASLYTLAFGSSARRGKILIDFKRNIRTSIAVAGFSLRARPDAPISVPVSWSELSRIPAPDAWTATNIRERLRRQRSDPWRGYWLSKQRLLD
jgi:bifunctional non-homologous end joining protein LigD